MGGSPSRHLNSAARSPYPNTQEGQPSENLQLCLAPLPAHVLEKLGLEVSVEEYVAIIYKVLGSILSTIKNKWELNSMTNTVYPIRAQDCPVKFIFHIK